MTLRVSKMMNSNFFVAVRSRSFLGLVAEVDDDQDDQKADD